MCMGKSFYDSMGVLCQGNVIYCQSLRELNIWNINLNDKGLV
jgi:hypothetical protein